MATDVDFEEHFLSSDPRRLIVAFAGGPMNVFQWGKTLARLGRSHVLFRDTRQVYYQDGIIGLGNASATLAYMNAVGRHCMVTTIGVSSGAFGALLYAQRGYVMRSIVFSALTTRVQHPEGIDPAWHQAIYDPAMPPTTELLGYYEYGPNTEVTAYISDGQGTQIDRVMVERLGIKDIRMVPGYSHGDLARGMRDAGMLDKVFR